MRKRTVSKIGVILVIYVLICFALHKALVVYDQDGLLLDILPHCSCPLDDQQQPASAKHAYNNTCSAGVLELSDHQTDVQMQDVLMEMRLDYPAYVWTHNGWIQQMDTTYNKHKWDANPLIVHVVPFSHNDPGWLSSFDSYFQSWTKPTLDLALEHLSNNANLTFVWAEVIFIQRWFNDLSVEKRKAFQRKIICIIPQPRFLCPPACIRAMTGRFEIVTGAWIMTDEAVVSYEAMLDQLIEGHTWLQKELGYVPQTAWAIDPFGHSPTMAYLLKLSGIESMLIQRVHYAIKKHLAFRQQLEFEWHPSWEVHLPDAGRSSKDNSIFCHMMPYMLYSIQYSCGPDINVCCQFDFARKKCWRGGDYRDPEPVSPFNIESKASDLVNQLRKKAHFFKHNHVLFPFGDDFRFHERDEWSKQFGSLTQIMDFVNARPDLHIQMRYSTLGAYMSAVKDSPMIPSLSGDFLLYSDRSDQYWAGFYTSRPLLKRLTRSLGSLLRWPNQFVQRLWRLDINFQSFGIGEMSSNQWVIAVTNYKGKACKMAGLWQTTAAIDQRKLSEWYGNLVELRRSSASLQHHDAITGTSRASVVSDFLNTIKSSSDMCRNLIGSLASTLMRSPSEDAASSIFKVLEQQLDSTSMPGLSVLKVDNAILVFNSLTQHRTEVVKVIVSSVEVSIVDISEERVTCQLNPIIDRNLQVNSDKFKLYFEISVPPLGMSVYHIRPARDVTTACHRAKIHLYNSRHQHGLQSQFMTSWHSEMSPMSISNAHMVVNFCRCNRLMQNVVLRTEGVKFKAHMNLVKYTTGKSLNPFADKSGAYIFLPDGPSQELIPDNPSALIIQGELMSSATTWLLPGASQTVAVYNITGLQKTGVYITNNVYLEHHETNTEVAMKLTTSVKSENGFYTDLNGFQMHRRTMQKRLPLQGNFHPMTNAVFLQDKASRVTVLSSHSHGVASLQPGCVELVLDRRLGQDDWRGLQEGLVDNVPIASDFLLLFETLSERRVNHDSNVGYLSLEAHHLSSMLNNPVIVLSGSSAVKPFYPLESSLPCDVHLVNLRSQSPKFRDTHTALLILHRFGYDCDASNAFDSGCSTSQLPHNEVSLRELFEALRVSSAEETTLTGLSTISAVNSSTIRMFPMDLKTWKLKF